MARKLFYCIKKENPDYAFFNDLIGRNFKVEKHESGDIEIWVHDDA